MKKRFLLGLAAMLVIVSGAIWFAAEESYVLNIKAELSTALDVTPHGDWNLGIVYSQQKYDAPLTVGLSAAAKRDPNLSSVSYKVGCNKPNPIGDGTTVTGPLSLCPYISLVDDDPNNSLPTQNSTEKLNSYVSTGSIGLTVASQSHIWLIQVDPPTCANAHQKDPLKQSPVAGSCDQDNSLFLSGSVYVELISVSTSSSKNPCSKKDDNFNTGCDALTGEFAFSVEAAISANARFAEIHFFKTDQNFWLAQVSGYTTLCKTTSSDSFSSHEKDGEGDTNTGENHENWILDFGSECITDGATLKIGADFTAAATAQEIKEVFFYDADFNLVGQTN